MNISVYAMAGMLLGIAAGYVFQPWIVLILVLVDLIWLLMYFLENKPNFLSITEREAEFFTFGATFLLFSTVSALVILYFFNISFISDNIVLR